MGVGVQGLKGDNFHTLTIFRKGDAMKNAGAVKIVEVMLRIGEKVSSVGAAEIVEMAKNDQ